MNKKLLSVLLAFSLLLSMGAFQFQVYAEDAESSAPNADANGTVLSEEPIVLQKYESDAYKQYLKDKENGDIEKYGGLIPSSTYKLEKAKAANAKTRSAAALPSVYDPRKTGMTTPVKDQGKRGLCWDFTAIATLETAVKYKYNKTMDYSENYYNYLTAKNAFGENTENPYSLKYNRELNRGGYPIMVLGPALLQQGPVLESDFPYSVNGYLSDISQLEQTPALYVYGYEYNSGYRSIVNIEEVQHRITDIKNIVYRNHSATLDITWTEDKNNSIKSPNCNDTTHAYYLPVPEGYMITNHGVCIVGWDDNFSKENFLESCRPDSDGAFIVKNSWSITKGELGYYYISYQDVSIFQSNILSVSDISDVNRYDHMYDHAESAPSEQIVPTPGEYWLANVYDITSDDQILDAVGVMTTAADTQFEIYANPNGGTLSTDTLQLIYSGTKAEAGYATIPLTEPLALSSSDGKFAVAIHIIPKGELSEEPSLIFAADGSSNASGESYISYNAKSWTDTSKTSSYYVNAYTSDVNNRLCVRFQTPSNWGSKADITLTDAGKYSGTTHAMTYISPGVYEYRNNNLTGCSIQISDGASGHKTSLLSAKGNVLVQNNTVTDKGLRPMHVEFKKPASWGNNVKIYYYSNDDNKTEHSPWPGVAMTDSGGGWYSYEINDMDNVRIIFTDGQLQTPTLLQPGIPLKRGQDLIWQDNSYSYDDGTPLNIRIYPDSSSWGNTATVSIANGPTQKTTVLQRNEKGYFEYVSPDISRGFVAISSSSWQSISNIKLGGKVTVKGNRWIAQPEKTSTITFKPPSEWKNPSLVYVYYYTDDPSAFAPYDWPGTPMEPDGNGRFTAAISDVGDVRVIFSDGSHQLPAFKQPGIQVKNGQHLINENKTSMYEDGTPLSVHFIPPDGWADHATISITYKDANGYEHSSATPMHLNDDGVYVKEYPKAVTGEIRIWDLLGNTTNELMVTGPVIVSQYTLTAVQRPTEPLHVTFQKPASWGDTVYMYYYANDDSYTNIMEWPGKVMQSAGGGKYTYDITDMKYTRAIFSDGVHKYPASANGVPINPQGETTIKGS